jgi:phosphoglycolate phosphatase
MSNIFFDLDGTLIHAHTRLYKLFQKLAPESTLSFEEYWAIKRSQKGHAAILSEMHGWAPGRIAAFETEWLSLIERPEWLALDRPLEGAEAVLRSLQDHNCYVVTARQHEDPAVSQIRSFGWKDLFKGIFVTGRERGKYELIHGTLETGNTDWYLGDTGIDIRTGKQLGVKTVALLSGFRDRPALEVYEPDFILNDLREFPALLDELG